MQHIGPIPAGRASQEPAGTAPGRRPVGVKERRRRIVTSELHIDLGDPEPDSEGDDIRDLRHYVKVADGLEATARAAAASALEDLASCVEVGTQARALLHTAQRERESQPLGARPKRKPRKKATSPPTRLRFRRGKKRR